MIRKIKRIDKLKQMDSKELAVWMCHEILQDDCEHCPFEESCSIKKNPIAKFLEEEVMAL